MARGVHTPATRGGLEPEAQRDSLSLRLVSRGRKGDNSDTRSSVASFVVGGGAQTWEAAGTRDAAVSCQSSVACKHSANCASCSTSWSSPFAVGRHFGSPPGAAFAMIQHHRRAPSLSPFASFQKKKKLHFRVPLGEESSCCPREHVARSLTMRREQSLRLLYPGVCYVSVPRRRPRKSIFPIAQPSSHRSSTRPRKQRPPSLSLVCLPPPYSTHKHAKSNPHSS